MGRRNEIMEEDSFDFINEPAFNWLKFWHEEREIGRLSWETGELVFTGDADESAKIFFDHLKGYVDGYIDSKKK